MESPNFNILEQKIKQTMDHVEGLISENDDLQGKISNIGVDAGTTDSGIPNKKAELIRNKIETMLTLLEEV